MRVALVCVVFWTAIAWQQQAAAGTESDYDRFKAAIRYYHHLRELSSLQQRRAKEMGISKKITPIQQPESKTPCISGSTTLFVSTLKTLVNSVSPVFSDAPSPVVSSYGTVDYGKNTVEKNKQLYVLWTLQVTGQTPFSASKIWLNHPPGLTSSQYLLQHYDKVINKPTIEIMGHFDGTDVNGLIEQLKCLAKLKYKGFNLIPWDVEDFKNHLDESHCKSALTTAESNVGFMREIENVRAVLEHVTQMSQNPNIVNWCIPPKSMLAKLQAIIRKI